MCFMICFSVCVNYCAYGYACGYYYDDGCSHHSYSYSYYYLNALRAYTATVPMTQYDVPEVSRRFRPHLPLHFAIQISEK